MRRRRAPRNDKEKKGPAEMRGFFCFARSPRRHEGAASPTSACSLRLSSLRETASTEVRGLWPVTKRDHEEPSRCAHECQARSDVPEHASKHRGPRREREDRPKRNHGPEPEFAPAFLTRDDD